MDVIMFEGEKAYPHKIRGYYATKSGKAISVKKKGGQGKLDYNRPHRMGVKYDKDGYEELCLSYVNEDGEHKRVSIKMHQFIWETFYGERDMSLTIDHIDGNKLNNSLVNLQQISREANTSKAKKGSTPWQKGRKHSARNFYNVFIRDVYCGTFDGEECMTIFGLTRNDIERNNTKRKTRMGIRLEKRVEDIEKVDNN